MASRAKAFFLALALTLGIISGVPPASASVTSLKEGSDKASVLFDPLAISKVELSHVTGGSPLTYDFLNTSTYQRANIKITLPGKAAVTLKNIGVRLKGQASRGDAKFPLKIKFDAFVKGQKFLGLKRMTLNNMVQDPSFVHEATAYKLYRAVGVPAPRTGYSKVSVDGQYFGLYLNLESIDKVFGKRWYSSTEHVYSGPYNCDILPNNSCYEASIGDTIRTDLDTAGAAANLHGGEWWAAINRVADMNRVIKLMATDIFLSNWDGYTDAVQNNHFVHFDKKGKFTIIPWGLDQTFTTDTSAELLWDASQPVFRGWSDHRSTLLDHCIEFAPCHSQLVREGTKISAIATRVNLPNYKNLIASKINPIISGQPDLRQTDIASLESQQNWIDTFVPQRQTALTSFLTTHSPMHVSVSIPTTIRPGTSVRATTGTIWEPNVTLTYQWQLDGDDIADATTATHVVLDSEIVHNLSVNIVLSKPNVAPTTVASNQPAVLPRLMKLTATPRIAGTLTTGKTLKVLPGKWDAGVSLSYQWKRNGVAISDGTGANYVLTAGDRGKQISVTVTAAKTNYVTTSRTSAKSSRVR